MDHPTPVDDDKAVPVVDPYTWAWLAEKAAGGLVAYAAGSLLSSVLGRDGLSASDVKGIVAAAVAELKRHITRSLTQQTITEVQGRINGCQELLRHYSNNPTQLHRLEEADVEAQLALSTLEVLGAPALTAYVNAVTVKLLCVSAICFKDADGNELINYEHIMRQGADHLTVGCGAISQSLKTRIDSVTPIRKYSTFRREPGGPGSGSNEVWHAEFHDNGSRRRYESMNSSAEALREATRARERILARYRSAYDDFQTSVVSPSQKAASDWEVGLAELKKRISAS